VRLGIKTEEGGSKIRTKKSTAALFKF
jgi:hypothetical protein